MRTYALVATMVLAACVNVRVDVQIPGADPGPEVDGTTPDIIDADDAPPPDGTDRGPDADATGPTDAHPDAPSPDVQTFAWKLPAGFPPPKVPASNPMTVEKVVLGRHLFYDERLSGNGTRACATCHSPEKAFTDGQSRSLGITGDPTPRSAPSLVNAGYLATLGWANPALTTLEEQMPVPMFGESPLEMGLTGKEGATLAVLKAEPRYGPLFAAAFPGQGDPFTFGNIIQAIACFERTLLSGGSRYDRYVQGGGTDLLSDAEKRGMDLFFSERFECFHCHGGFALTDSVTFEGLQFSEPAFHNTGLYNVGGTGTYPPGGEGLYAATGKASDHGRMKAPTLRNIALTAPYMHDGSLFTLQDVLDFYAAGGRNVESGPYAGDGRANPNKDSLVRPFLMAPGEKADLLAFLGALTDEAFLAEPSLQNPWLGPPPDGLPEIADAAEVPADVLEVVDPGPDVPTWTTRIGPMMNQWCVSCHDSKKSGADRNGAPLGHDFDTYTNTKSMALQANDVIQIGKMPPSGPLPEADRAAFQAWLYGGMPY